MEEVASDKIGAGTPLGTKNTYLGRYRAHAAGDMCSCMPNSSQTTCPYMPSLTRLEARSEKVVDSLVGIFLDQVHHSLNCQRGIDKLGTKECSPWA